MAFVQTRRRLLTDLAFVGAAGIGGVGLSSLSGSGQSRASEPPPEITTVRLAKTPITCVAPQYVAAELLRIEGFTDIQYVGLEGDIGKRGKLAGRFTKTRNVSLSLSRSAASSLHSPSATPAPGR